MLELNILKGLKASDEKAFEFIFKSYFQSLYNYAQALLHSNYKAEEIISDLFVKLWENREQLHIEVSLKSYLYKTIYHSCIDIIRKEKVEDKYRAFFLDYHSEICNSGSDYPLSKIIGNELENQIESIINKLPAQCREFFLLSRDEGLSHKEIALRKGVSVNTVNTQIGRALKKIKEELKDYLPLLIFILSDPNHFSK